jgi:hypothetical protein
MDDQKINFIREHRYIVLKISNLTDCELKELENMHLPTKECVVVESDWPEFEPVWEMIKNRIKKG